MEKQIDKNIGVAVGIIALLGGLVRALSDEETNWKHLTVKTITGGFVGIIFAFAACHVFGEEIYIVGASAGAGGVMGTEGVRIIAAFLQKVLGINIKKIK